MLEKSIVLGALLLGVVAAATPVEMTVTDIKGGGVVLLCRHNKRLNPSPLTAEELAKADGNGDCVTGADLTKDGILDAEVMAKGITTYGVVAESVHTSPSCRTRQMAKTIFNTEGELRRELLYSTALGAGEKELKKALFQMLLTVPVESGKVRFLLSHVPLLTREYIGSDYGVSEGDCAVFQPKGIGSTPAFQLLGHIPLKEWK